MVWGHLPNQEPSRRHTHPRHRGQGFRTWSRQRILKQPCDFTLVLSGCQGLLLPSNLLRAHPETQRELHTSLCLVTAHHLWTLQHTIVLVPALLTKVLEGVLFTQGPDTTHASPNLWYQACKYRSYYWPSSSYMTGCNPALPWLEIVPSSWNLTEEIYLLTSVSKHRKMYSLLQVCKTTQGYKYHEEKSECDTTKRH